MSTATVTVPEIAAAIREEECTVLVGAPTFLRPLLRRAEPREVFDRCSCSREKIKGVLKGFSVGGAQRWESKAAVGFLGKVGDARTAPTVINVADPTKPVYDQGNFYTDVWVSYSRRILKERYGLKVQLNVNNLLDVKVDVGNSYTWARYTEPRQFVTTFTVGF